MVAWKEGMTSTTDGGEAESTEAAYMAVHAVVAAKEEREKNGGSIDRRFSLLLLLLCLFSSFSKTLRHDNR